MIRRLCAVLALALLALPAHGEEGKYAIALHGDLKYPPNFQHFDYVNPDAPKGGTLRLSAVGTFDTLNPYTLKGMGGMTAAGSSLVFDTLMTASADEPGSEYGLIAESVTVAPDRSWVSYKLRPEAHFQDGSPITPEDVIFSFDTLREKGHPFYRSYYKDVVKAEQSGPREVKFTFKDNTNTELPYIMGQLPVISKKFWQGKDFASTTLDPVLGSGPYKVANVDPGRSITYERVKDWWAKDLPVNRGRFNFDTIHFDYYRDETVELEAFLAGHFDFRSENIAKEWALAYDTPAVKNGLIKKQMIHNEVTQGMQGFAFNMRKPLFQDRRVREALNLAFDFEWSNKNVAYGAYKRLASYFENSELAGHGLPSEAEMKLLEPWKGKIPDDVFTREYRPPVTDGSGDDRENLRKAADLLKAAGWIFKDGRLVNGDGQPFVFDYVDESAMFERWVEPWLRNLERLGIKVNYHIVDSAQFQNLMNDFNFDMTIANFPQSPSPGNEESDYFSSSTADVKGSRNLIGIKDPAVDDLIGKIIHAESREELVTAVRALDRVLCWNEYTVPNWYIDSFRIAYWDIFGHPQITPKYDLSMSDTWWIDPAKEPKIEEEQRRNR